MIGNYIKLAWRNLSRNKTFSIINIFGLAIGLTSCILISLYVIKEFSYDKHHKNGDRVYQVGTTSILEGKETRFSTTAAPMLAAMQAEFPEIESTTRLMPLFQDDKTFIQYKEGNDIRSFYESDGYMADSTFFDLFTYPFIEGNPSKALEQPNTVVLSEELATKLFGSQPALNKTIHINSTTNGAYDFKVTGVYKESATPSHINARFIMAMQSGEVGPWIRNLTGIVNNNLFFSYLMLKPGTDPHKLQAKFDGFVTKYAGEDLKASGRGRKQFLTEIKDVHLYANTEGNVTPSGSVRYLFILISIAVVTLLIACVNFMNLSTARSSKRAVEIGVRKVLGAERTSLVRQFIAEAILIAFIALFISFGLALMLKPLFEQVSGKQYYFSTTDYAWIVAGFVLIAFLVGLIAGLYPAFYLSAFKPVKVLKGKLTNSLGAVSLRKALVVFQFVISVGLIVASITIGSQMRYMRNKDLGFEKDRQVVIPFRTTASKEIYSSYKNALLANNSVTNAGASIYYPGVQNITDWLLYRQGTPSNQTRTMFMNFVDDSYLQTLDLKVKAGRLFSKSFPADTSNRIIINERAVKEFGFESAEAAIGQNIAASRNGGEMLFPIIGVVKDFHFQGFQSEIKSYGFLLSSEASFSYMITHLKGENIGGALSEMENAWKRLNPNEPFEYSFLDDDFQKHFVAEERLATIIRYFTIIAIFISCLGLFGLTSFTVEQRTKEIGIRKVLGASTAGIIRLLSADFLKLVLISFVVASPLAWYFVNQWLQGFAYRVPFTIWIILAGGFGAVLIAFLTISLQSIRVASSNPINSLRTE